MYNKKDAGLGFVGHTDTVEYTDGWKYEKFNLTKENDKLYGLGVCDMKAGIAAMLTAISQLDFKGFRKGIKIYLTYDEEIGFSGIKDVIEYEKIFPDTIIVGEPTNNEIIVGSKGLMEYEILFRGIKTHSSTPEKGKNAIMSSISFINELNEFYEKEIRNELNNNFEIPYTTMNIGKIQGGSAINSVPDLCKVLIDFRTIDKIVEDKISNKMKELAEKHTADVREFNRLSAFFNKSDLSTKTCNFITEASFLKQNCIILGAGPITAHEVNESISVNSLYKLVEQYKEIIENKCK